MAVLALEEQIAELSARLDTYHPQRYPVQHATAQFHLGTAMLQADRVVEALACLGTAEEIFGAVGLSLERAKAANMRGVALRTAGSRDQAVEAFTRAARAFRELAHPVEEAAASYNLGMASCGRNNPDDARRAFTHSAQLFVAAGRMPEAAAAAREHATLLLGLGEVSAAVELLAPAMEMAFRGRDMAGGGAAANALGLALLATGDIDAAVSAFRDAVGAHPRSVRPAEHAMAKANLALALEQGGDSARSRLAADQALGIRTAAEPVRAQAEEILKRLPPATGAELFDVLDDTPVDRWVSVVREELLRWADAVSRVRADAAAAWVDGHLRQPGRGAEFAQGLLGALLELPPASYEAVVRDIVMAVADRSTEDSERFRAAVRSGMARFALPQWQRVAATFNAASTELGEPAEWS